MSAEHLVQTTERPQSYQNIMESVKSLEKAFEYHKNEEKLLNDINTELKEYWNLQDNKSEAEEQQLVSTKSKIKEKSKSEHKEKESESKKAPSDDKNTEIDENLQLDDNNFLQLSDTNEKIPKDLSLESIMNSNPDLFKKELQ